MSASAACGARRGFTLVELMAVCAVAGILAATAWPSLKHHLLRAGRADGVQALTRVEAAQSRYQALHGLYASDLAVLAGAPQPDSEQRRYTVALQPLGAEGYVASAQPVGAQSADADCSPLTLEVRLGFATRGPNARCWNR